MSISRSLAPLLGPLLALLAGAGTAAAQAALPLDTLRVDAASRAAAGIAAGTRSVEVIDAARIRRSPARTVGEVLRWALGVEVMPRSPALVDVGIRGSSFEQLLVLVDGVRASDAQTGHFDLDLAVPLDQIERIEIVRGAGSALHGADAMGGVVHIVTRRAGGGRVRAERGSFGTTALAASGAARRGPWSADLALDGQRSDGHRPGTDYRIGMGRLALSAPLAGRALAADLALAGRDFGADGFYGPFPSYERTRTATATLAWRAPREAALSIEPALTLRRHTDDFILRRADPSFYRNQHATLQAGGELTARYAAAPALRLAAGVEGYVDRLDSERLGDRSERRGALTAEAVAGRVGRLTGTAGLRLDGHEAFGPFLSPSLAAAWWPGSRARLRASLGRSFRTPTWTERFYRDPANVGDPALDPERAWTAEVGGDLYPAPGVRLGAAAYRRSASELIDWARPLGDATSPWRTRNVDRARYRGLEAEATVDNLLGLRWSAQGSWLSLATSEEPGYLSKYALRPMTESVSLTAERAVVRGVDGLVRAGRARRRGEAAYLLLDARLSLRLAAGRLYLDAQNLGDRRYPDITGAAAPGRALLLGAEWSAGR